jgi:PP-loop superfamily ATP-utilizing enzyme
MKLDNPVSPATETDPSAAWASVFQSLGLPSYRVRVEGRIACIEAPREDFARLLDPAVRPVLLKHSKTLGYLFVTLDMG